MNRLSNIPSYIVWKDMKARCHNVNDPNYYKYGAKGIFVCEDWLDRTRIKVGEYIGGMGQIMPKKWPLGYLNFINDMGEKPLNKSLDRINNEKGYNPSNCRWATIHQQASNKRNNNDIVGVSFDINSGLWEAYLVINGERVLRKRSKNKSIAIKARKEAEMKYNI